MEPSKMLLLCVELEFRLRLEFQILAGLYFRLRNIPDLPYPEAVFVGSFFRSNPKPFYTLVRSIFPERLCPTDTHKFFALLHKKGILRRVYTQNIDALETLGGLPEEK